MLKEKYRYNPELVKFEKVQRTIKQKLLLFCLHFSVYAAFAILLNIGYSAYFESPNEKRLKREQHAILSKYEIMNIRLDELNNELVEINQRDDQIYRAIFELDAIPSSIREAGFGGVNRYAHLHNLNESATVINTAKRIDKFIKQVYVQSKSYDEIIPLVKNKDKMISSVPAIQPIGIKDLNRISSYFGRRIDPYTGKYKWHEGMDFTGSVGTEIYCTGNGKVIDAGNSHTGFGHQIIVDHGFGYKTRYAHLSKVLVKKGDIVERGEVIGLLGNSGKSTGPHLHYEVIKNNVPLNPINFYFNDINAEQYDQMVKQASKAGGITMD